MVATPMHGGQCTGQFAKSLGFLMHHAGHRGLPIDLCWSYGNSVAQARTYCAQEFLRSECTHLMFIDADIEFDFEDVFKFLELSTGVFGDVIAGTYPKKGPEKEYSLVTLEQLSMDEIGAVKFVGCGFMLIRRRTFEALSGFLPQSEWYTDPERGKTLRFFHDQVVDGHLLAEDHWFCHIVRKAGMAVALCPWVKLNHVGQHKWLGNLNEIAQDAAE